MEKIRLTRQKKLIVEKLRKANRPMSIGELYRLVQLDIPQIAKSTVYRNIDALLKQDLIDKYYLNDTEIFYRIKEDEKEHHHYFICECCKKMYHLPHCPLHDFEDYIEKMGFTVREHFVQITGICGECKVK